MPLQPIIEIMRHESSHHGTLASRTARYPHSIDQEIERLCREEGLIPSVVLRHIIIIGWHEMRKELGT